MFFLNFFSGPGQLGRSPASRPSLTGNCLLPGVLVPHGAGEAVSPPDSSRAAPRLYIAEPRRRSPPRAEPPLPRPRTAACRRTSPPQLAPLPPPCATAAAHRHLASPRSPDPPLAYAALRRVRCRSRPRRRSCRSCRRTAGFPGPV